MLNFNFLWPDVKSGHRKRKKSDLLIWQVTGDSASDLVSSDILWRKPRWSGDWNTYWRLMKRFVTCEVWNIWWQVAFEACSKTCDSSSDILRHWKSTEHDLTKKEWCDIWSNKTCDRANATSCSGGRALNWGLMERGLMKRNVTWLAMSLEDSADRSKISTPHSTLERRSQIWWRATLNYLVDEDHLRRWSNQMAASE